MLICQCSATHAQHHRLKQHWESTNDFLCLLKYTISCSCSSALLPVSNFVFDISFSSLNSYEIPHLFFFFSASTHNTQFGTCKMFLQVSRPDPISCQLKVRKVNSAVNNNFESFLTPPKSCLKHWLSFSTCLWFADWDFKMTSANMLQWNGSPEVVFKCKVAAYITCNRPCAKEIQYYSIFFGTIHHLTNIQIKESLSWQKVRSLDLLHLCLWVHFISTEVYNIYVWLSRSGQQVKGSVFGVLGWLFYAICTLMGESVLSMCQMRSCFDTKTFPEGIFVSLLLPY